jgi:Flp pilus assembly protein TadD
MAQTSPYLGTRSSYALGILLRALTLLLAGCAGNKQANTVQNLNTFQAEQSPKKLVERGRGFAAVGDLTRAEEYLGAALERGADPKFVMPLLLAVCVQDGRLRLAVQYAEDQLRKHPADVRTRFVLGTLYAGLGESEHAETALRRVLQEKPDEAQAHYALAVLLRDRGDSAGAEDQFREYVRLDPRGPYAEEARASLTRSTP